MDFKTAMEKTPDTYLEAIEMQKIVFTTTWMRTPESRARCKALSRMLTPLHKQYLIAEKERKRREAEARRKPVDLTNPEIRKAYSERNRRLMNEQAESQKRALARARSERDQLGTQLRASPDLDPVKAQQLMARRRELKETIERIEWEMAGAPDDEIPASVLANNPHLRV